VLNTFCATKCEVARGLMVSRGG